MKKNIVELRAEKAKLKKKNQDLRQKTADEKRSFTTEESEQINANLRRISEINEDIEELEAELRAAGRGSKGSENDVTLRSLLYNAMTTQEVVVISVEKGETRAVDYTATGTVAAGKGLIATAYHSILPALRDRMLLGVAGATILTGLKSNITIPTFSGTTADWAAENGMASTGGGSFEFKSLSPKRLTTKIIISKQLLLQDSLGVEELLKKDLVDAISAKLEATLLSGIAGTASRPAGIFAGIDTENVAEMAWNSLVDLESDVDTANLLTDKACYLMHTSLYGKAKKTVKATGEGAGFILDGKQINGYNTGRSNSVYKTEAGAGVAFGDFSELIIGNFGNIELTVDPYTGVEQDTVKVVVNSYWDAAVRRTGAIKVALMK